ncbi:MAG: ElyC/SanA/YdcF family protein [Coriobacteriia bacterium]|nr:ElyC/SanA/YdcF family protein [Coriobacteriia bacterium]
MRRLLKYTLRLAVAAVVACAVVLGGANALVMTATSDAIVGQADARSRAADAIVVLGASVNPDGTPSDILRARLDDAVALYKEGAGRKVIASGDNRELHYNESQAMKRYLVEHGVPSQDVFCDYAGFSTYESMYRAKNVFGAKSIVVATQEYHLPRALFAAKALGMEALGVAPAGEGAYDDQFSYDLREIPARAKDAVQALLNAPSTFVGDAIDLAGSGDDVK